MIINPYFDRNFFGFFALLSTRLWKAAFGKEALELAPDEVQCMVLLLMGIASAFVGTFLIIKKMTMLANAISHTILLGIVVTFYFTALSGGSWDSGKIELYLLAAFATALLTTLVTQFLHRVAKWEEDASVGIVFTSFFALGILLVNLLTRNAHIGAEVVMGNVDALSKEDIQLSLIVLLIVLAAICIPFRGWKLTAFDAGTAKILGWSPERFNYALMFLAALAVVGGLRALGVLMVLTFMTAPPLMARLFFHKLHQVLIGSAGISGIASLVGVALSRHLLTVFDLAFSTGGLIAVLLGTCYLIVAISTNKKFSLSTGKTLPSS
jgi:manganese/zinc/iron transport system permease protein